MLDVWNDVVLRLPPPTPISRAQAAGARRGPRHRRSGTVSGEVSRRRVARRIAVARRRTGPGRRRADRDAAAAGCRCARRAMHVFTGPGCLAHDPGDGPSRSTRPPRGGARRAPRRARRDAGRIARRPARGDCSAATIATISTSAAAHERRAVAASWDPTPRSTSTAGRPRLAATGAALAALRHALGRSGHAFAAIRPPGHHALRNRAMGFCIVNHVAVVASAARAQGANGC